MTTKGRTLLSSRARTAAVPAPEEGQSLADQAYQQLEEMIVTLELAPGAVLSEAGLSARMGIGRTPIREALKRLEIQRLVSSVPRRGLLVREMNVAEHFALLEVMRPLDHLLATKAARWATEAQRKALRGEAKGILEAAKKGDKHAYLFHDRECDRIVMQAAHNPFAMDALTPLYSHCRRIWCSYSRGSDLLLSAEKHARLMLAVAEGDEEEAGRASDALLDFLESFSRAVIGVV
ncbi:GntR family transcriptional regulator [Geothrix limicola]|uniref:GntR family transcriptional regulator n=1 Tax=Geothrix limicola TaxID=2927978 RepID=A0ABQ5QFI3_9BACT|nr:GntR family transcriptional regulator [Geothrix limicola]GLH73123.1 GntR family transcriptional regulator [Geothrix limicola]